VLSGPTSSRISGQPMKDARTRPTDSVRVGLTDPRVGRSVAAEGGGALPADGDVLVDLATTWSRARAVEPWALAAAVTLGCGRCRWRGGSSIGLSQPGQWLFRPADGARSGGGGRRGRSASAFRGVPDDSGSGRPCSRSSRPRGDPVIGVLTRTGS
jgi:hypothetical protein